VDVAGTIEHHRSRPIQRRLANRSTVRRRLSRSGAAERLDHASAQVDLTDAMVADVANQQPAPARVDGDAVRLPQLCTRGRTTVARESRASSSGKRADPPCLRLNSTNRVIVALGD